MGIDDDANQEDMIGFSFARPEDNNVDDKHEKSRESPLKSTSSKSLSYNFTPDIEKTYSLNLSSYRSKVYESRTFNCSYVIEENIRWEEEHFISSMKSDTETSLNAQNDEENPNSNSMSFQRIREKSDNSLLELRILK